MPDIKLKTIHRLRYDTRENTVPIADTVKLAKGEPFLVEGYYDGKDVLVIGDGDESKTVSTFLANNDYFVRGIGAGYNLPVAASTQLGGVKPADGLKIGSTGDMWIDVASLVGNGLVVSNSSAAYPGFGKLSVDLSNFDGNIKISGTLTANEIKTNVTSTGELIELRKGSENLLGSEEFAGIVIHNVLESGVTAKLGIDGEGRVVFSNKTDNYLIPYVLKSADTFSLVRILDDGLIENASLKNISITIRPKQGTEGEEHVLDLLGAAEPEIELIIPRKLSDLEDYDETATGPTFVSSNDRTLWNQVITSAAYGPSTLTTPSITNDTYTFADGTERTTKKLLLPRSDIQLESEGAIELTSNEKLDLKVINPVKSEISIKNAPYTMTYISDIIVDQYGRVKRIEYEQITINP